MGLPANSFLKDMLTKYQNYKGSLSSEKASNKTQTDIKQKQLARTEASIDNENTVIDQYNDLLAVLEENTPLNRMYSGIKEFVVDNSGMCGMGMGMGHMEVNSSLVLTGKELIAMSSVLVGNSGGIYSPQTLVDQLHNMGIGNAQLSEDGQSIELVRIDENGNKTTVKFCDANGDGMLNDSDYDFSDALAKLDADLGEWFKQKEEIEAKIEAEELKLENLEGQRENTRQDLKTLETEAKGINIQLNETQQNIDKTEDKIEIDQQEREEQYYQESANEENRKNKEEQELKK